MNTSKRLRVTGVFFIAVGMLVFSSVSIAAEKATTMVPQATTPASLSQQQQIVAVAKKIEVSPASYDFGTLPVRKDNSTVIVNSGGNGELTASQAYGTAGTGTLTWQSSYKTDGGKSGYQTEGSGTYPGSNTGVAVKQSFIIKNTGTTPLTMNNDFKVKIMNDPYTGVNIFCSFFVDSTTWALAQNK